MEEWNFNDSENWYEMNPSLIKFDGEYGGDRYVFAIPVSALNDFFETDDTPEAAKDNYQENIEEIQNLAIRFALDFDSNDEPPHYFIGSEKFKEYF